MLGKTKYKRGDEVKIELHGEIIQGEVYIVEAYGTLEQNQEPSYDIMVELNSERCLIKHVRESEVIE